MQRDVTNTTEKLKNPLEALGFLAEEAVRREAGERPGKSIEDMEAAGQRELIFSDVLPVDMHRNTQEEFEALGFTFGDVVEGDPIFRYAMLPEGWQKRGTDHNMWSIIVDAEGNERVGIFYKAAFYDRHAHMYIRQDWENDSA